MFVCPTSDKGIVINQTQCTEWIKDHDGMVPHHLCGSELGRLVSTTQGVDCSVSSGEDQNNTRVSNGTHEVVVCWFRSITKMFLSDEQNVPLSNRKYLNVCLYHSTK